MTPVKPKRYLELDAEVSQNHAPRGLNISISALKYLFGKTRYRKHIINYKIYVMKINKKTHSGNQIHITEWLIFA